jgi:YidC/Oxa1 family membrane protein insertase
LAGNSNYVIDVFTKFGRTNWDAFAKLFAGEQASIISKCSEEIMHVNGVFGGLNIAETPMAKPFPGLIIPVVSVILQYLQTHLMMAKSPQMDDNNPAAASMKTMNKIMPLTSGFFCLMFPIGAGIYLVASSLFRIIQQIFVDKYLEHLNVDTMIEKNMEKERLKREKMHLEASDGSIKNVANMRTSNNLNDIAKLNTGKKQDKNAQVSDNKYEKGSIASIAHMMDNSSKK